MEETANITIEDQLVNPYVYMGSDPELFLVDEATNEIVPSNVLIPDDPLTDFINKVVRDGVQIELNPEPDTCREMSAFRLSQCFVLLKKQIDMAAVEGKRYKIAKAGVIELTDTQMEKLPKECLEFGCKPSFNIYDNNAKVGVEGTQYKYRSGSGHIHLGKLPYSIYYNRSVHFNVNNKMDEVDKRTELVALLDVVLGNTCVLIDRDPLQVERRKHYGRAGEYRLPFHGLEYRTLSNFWLRDYALASLVFGLARYAVMVLHSSVEMKKNFSGELLNSVDLQQVRLAINQNDFELAKENFKAFERFLKKYPRWISAKTAVKDLPITPTNIMCFRRFVADVQERGLDAIFPKDILSTWTKPHPSLGYPMVIDTTGITSVGWERFLERNYRSR